MGKGALLRAVPTKLRPLAGTLRLCPPYSYSEKESFIEGELLGKLFQF